MGDNFLGSLNARPLRKIEALGVLDDFEGHGNGFYEQKIGCPAESRIDFPFKILFLGGDCNPHSPSSFCKPSQIFFIYFKNLAFSVPGAKAIGGTLQLSDLND
jgi:hypothetical protein